jgi:hypothetical protein
MCDEEVGRRLDDGRARAFDPGIVAAGVEGVGSVHELIGVPSGTFTELSLQFLRVLVRMSNNEHDVHFPPGRIGVPR